MIRKDSNGISALNIPELIATRFTPIDAIVWMFSLFIPPIANQGKGVSFGICSINSVPGNDVSKFFVWVGKIGPTPA